MLVRRRSLRRDLVSELEANIRGLLAVLLSLISELDRCLI